MLNPDTETLFNFPCEFPIKVLGLAEADFNLFVEDIVRRHCPYFEATLTTRRFSSGGKYLSVTVTIMAQSRVQLDCLYSELSSQKRVMMVF